MFTSPPSPKVTTLLVGFDSAWTSHNSGALVGVLRFDDGDLCELGTPQIADYTQAETIILAWQRKHSPMATMVLLDQPTIVKNATGQRPVENIVGSPIGLRYGGTQPANTGKADMFGQGAPVWLFLSRFGGAADPLRPLVDTRVIETYPALAMIALDWTLPDSRVTGRLPKYNPERTTTFAITDWQHVCKRAAEAFRVRKLELIVEWLESTATRTSPRKSDQDGVDACLCLLAALYLVERKACLMVGDLNSGYIVVPDDARLRRELENRCGKTGRAVADWVRVFRLPER